MPGCFIEGENVVASSVQSFRKKGNFANVESR